MIHPSNVGMPYNLMCIYSQTDSLPLTHVEKSKPLPGNRWTQPYLLNSSKGFRSKVQKFPGAVR